MYGDLRSVCDGGTRTDILNNAVEIGSNPFGCTDYLNQKKPLRDTGVSMYEYLGDQALHTKALVVGDDLTIAGSCNFDMRSVYLDTELMLEYIEELVSAGVQGIALSPDTAPEVRQCIDELHAQGIPVITLNADAPGSKRLCFIGMDNYRAGQTAACLLRLMLPEGGKVLPLAGHLNNTAHNNRLNGFLDAIKAENTLNISTLAFQPCFDRDDYSHEITQHALRANPDLAAIYVASNGQKGVCQAIEEEGRKGRVKVAAFDLNELNMELLQSDSLSFVLDQEAFEQGYRPPFLLYEYLLHKKKPEKELLYTDIAIRTKYNSDMALVCTTMQNGL